MNASENLLNGKKIYNSIEEEKKEREKTHSSNDEIKKFSSADYSKRASISTLYYSLNHEIAARRTKKKNPTPTKFQNHLERNRSRKSSKLFTENIWQYATSKRKNSPSQYFIGYGWSVYFSCVFFFNCIYLFDQRKTNIKRINFIYRV